NPMGFLSTEQDCCARFAPRIGDRSMSGRSPFPLSLASGGSTSPRTEACGLERTFVGAAGSPPGIRRRKAGTDKGTAIARSRLREFQKAAAPDCRSRGAARGAEARGRMPPLCFDDVAFRALYKCDDLMTFSLWDLKRV